MKANQNTKSECVKVHVRIRPFTKDELQQDSTSPIENVDTVNNAMTGKNKKITNLIVKREYDKKNFSYDTIFPMNSTQAQIFNTAAKGVVDVNK